MLLPYDVVLRKKLETLLRSWKRDARAERALIAQITGDDMQVRIAEHGITVLHNCFLELQKEIRDHVNREHLAVLASRWMFRACNTAPKARAEKNHLGRCLIERGCVVQLSCAQALRLVIQVT